MNVLFSMPVPQNWGNSPSLCVSRILALVLSPMSFWSLSALLTVAVETPHFFAMSFSDTIFYSLRAAYRRCLIVFVFFIIRPFSNGRIIRCFYCISLIFHVIFVHFYMFTKLLCFFIAPFSAAPSLVSFHKSFSFFCVICYFYPFSIRL